MGEIGVELLGGRVLCFFVPAGCLSCCIMRRAGSVSKVAVFKRRRLSS